MMLFAAVVMTFGALFGDARPEAAMPGADAPAPCESAWRLSIGASNYYPRLRESQKKIDLRITRLYGWLPFWKAPTTFSDWRDRHILWELTVGVGRDLSPKTALTLWAGGASSEIKNKERYGPLHTDIRFACTSVFLYPELAWHPRGRVNYDDAAGKRGGDWARAAITGAKPYLAVAAGYTWSNTEGKGKLRLPLLGTVFRQAEKETHHLFMISPRLGVELPVGKNAGVGAAAGYYFHTTHSREYNGVSISLYYQRRF